VRSIPSPGPGGTSGSCGSTPAPTRSWRSSSPGHWDC